MKSSKTRQHKICSCFASEQFYAETFPVPLLLITAVLLRAHSCKACRRRRLLYSQWEHVLYVYCIHVALYLPTHSGSADNSGWLSSPLSCVPTTQCNAPCSSLCHKCCSNPKGVALWFYLQLWRQSIRSGYSCATVASTRELSEVSWKWKCVF